MGLYLDPSHLKPYQADDIAYLRTLGSGVFAWDTGMGKSRGLLAMACSLLDEHPDATILLVCEQNKLTEWEPDTTTLTSLTCALYYGPGRAKILTGPLPQILITTYETARADIGGVEQGDGPLTAALVGRKLLVAYDEMPKLADAGSGLYQGHEYLLERTRALVYGLTATPYTRDWDSVYNMFRLVCPQVLPDRDKFERLCVYSRSVLGKATFIESAIREHLLEPIEPFLVRRRKTDPEVAHLFPRMREVTLHTRMTDMQEQVYQVVNGLGTEEDTPGLGNVLRMLASYPEALIGADGRLAKKIVSKLGEDILTSIRPGKLDHLIRLVANAVTEGRKTVIFSFFGPTVLPLLARDLEPAGVPILLHYGQLTAADRRRALERFRSHDGPALLLSSDAGSRGINLPQASRLIEYEGARTHMVGAQRRNRIHRLDSPHPEVVCATLIADGTVEQMIADRMLRRNEDTDRLNGDVGAQGFITATRRRQLMQVWDSRVAA